MLFFPSTTTKHMALAPSSRRFKFEKNVVASLGTATIWFQIAYGEVLADGTEVIQLNVSALFGLLFMRVANAGALSFLTQL
jgi:hypothetical protein